MEDLDALLNTGAVPQDERTADFIAESRANRSFCYETAERGALRVAGNPEAFKTYLDVQSRFLRYTPNNVLLILEQKPEARKLGNMAYWRDKNTFVKRAERSRPVFVLEPGKEYRREDNTIGQYYNARKLYDISQTTLAPSEWGLEKTYGDRQRIQALISRTPAAIHTVEEEPEGAVFVPKEHSILVQKGMGAEAVFRCLSRELAHVEFAKGEEGYDRECCGFQAECVSYILCKRYGVEPEGPEDLGRAQALLSGMDPQRIKQELAVIRDAAGKIAERMEKSLSEQERRQKGQTDRQQEGR